MKEDNLKTRLINKTIEMITTEGMNSVSMRSLAEKCNVSRQAPYVYFKNKDDMLKACSDYVSLEFSKYLLESIEGKSRLDSKTLNYMGIAYVKYFKEHPYYYDFIYNNGLFKIYITLDYIEDNFKPFDVFRELCVELVKEYHIPDSIALGSLFRCFSIVQGAAQLVSSNNVVYDGDWDTLFLELFNFGGE